MKRLKRQLRKAFTTKEDSHHSQNSPPLPLPPPPLPQPSHLRGHGHGHPSASSLNPGSVGGSGLTLAESISELNERLWHQGVIYEDAVQASSALYTPSLPLDAYSHLPLAAQRDEGQQTSASAGPHRSVKRRSVTDSGYHSASSKAPMPLAHAPQPILPKAVSEYPLRLKGGRDFEATAATAAPAGASAFAPNAILMRPKKKRWIELSHGSDLDRSVASPGEVASARSHATAAAKPRHSWHKRLSLFSSLSSHSIHSKAHPSGKEEDIRHQRGRMVKTFYGDGSSDGWAKSEAEARYRRRSRRSSTHAVVHEGVAGVGSGGVGGGGLGSDGESVEASPSTSDEVASPDGHGHPYHVKMRSKPTRRWSEQDIQKRLSLPADLRLPLSVVEKLNRTPTLAQPMTRKNRRFSLSEIGFGKLETYQKLEKLGEGTYATVFKGRSRLTEAVVALKEIRLEAEEGAPCTAIREVSLLRDLKHANVVTLHDIIHTERSLTLVFEFVDKDLKQYMDECGNLMAIANARLFAFQLLRGLAYCHARRVLHRDLKPQNLLITAKGELKLADFGLARAKSVPTKTYSHEVVTLWYRPPDVLLGTTEYSTQIDMWGVGCILAEMAGGRPFFPGSNVEEQLHLIFRALGTPRPSSHPIITAAKDFASYSFPLYKAEPLVNHVPRLDPDGLELLTQLLHFEGKRRVPARAAMRHSFFSSLPPPIYDLADSDSVMSLPGLSLVADPGHQPPSHRHHSHRHSAKSRRQSMLL